MTRLPNVYVVQHNKVQGREVDISPAYEHGNVQVLLPQGQVLNGAAASATLRAKLQDFSDLDFILALGDPVAIGMASAIAAERNGGRFKVLKWDRRMNEGRGGYIPVQVDINHLAYS